MECGPEKHRGVTVREHKPIAVGPDRVLWVEAHNAVPDGVDQRGERHRRAGVSRFGLLDRVNRKRANGIDTQLIEFGLGGWFCYLRDTHVSSPCYVLLVGSLGFERSHLSQTAQVTRSLAELGFHERLDENPRDGGSHGSTAHAEN